jgi:perosamine synthetase
MDWKIPLFRIYWDDDDIKAVSRIIESGASWACGDAIDKFEIDIAAYNGSKYAVTVNSGTSALHILLLSMGIGPGDEIIVPSFTFIASANAALFVGAKPVFADIEEATLGLDPQDVERKITERTKAILPVHFAGSPCMIEELRSIAKKYRVLLLEDAAESMGASIKGKKVGTFGEAAILSFCQNKIITTGEGGAVVTDSRELAGKLRLLRSHGRAEGNYFSTIDQMDYVSLGYNFRISSLTAALGLSQIQKIDRIIRIRRQKAEYFTRKLSKIEGILPPRPSDDYRHVYQMYPVIVREKAERNLLMKYLSAQGIMTKVYFDPVHLTEFYRKKFGYKGGELPVTERISEHILSLPIYPTLKEDEIDYICRNIQAFFEKL